MKIRKAVIPAAGLGTRFLPATSKLGVPPRYGVRPHSKKIQGAKLGENGTFEADRSI